MYFARTYLAAAACILASLVRCQAGSDMNCADNTRRAHVFSHRNQTGHLITEVDIERIIESGRKAVSKKDEPWEVDVEHSTNLCRGTNRVQRIKLVFTDKPTRVGSDYTLFPGVGYYKFHANATNWSRARVICADEGAHLAIINSEEEAAALTQLFQANPQVTGGSQDWASVGLYQNGSNFLTIFDNPIESTGFNKWNSVIPTSASNYRAVFNRTKGVLSQITDSSLWAFICEQEL